MDYVVIPFISALFRFSSIWTSTAPFIPHQSTSFGQIKLGYNLRMEFDFVFTGRSNIPHQDQYEMFFRLGFDSELGTGCEGQSSRYPALWLSSNRDELYLSLSNRDSCSTGYLLSGFGILNEGISYHMVIEYDSNSLMVSIEDGNGIWTDSWPRSATLDEHVGQYVDVWWMSGKFGTSFYNVGGGIFSNIAIVSSQFVMP